METNPVIKTNRLILRRFTLADGADVVRLAGDVEVASTTLRIPHPYKPEDAEQWINGQQKNFEDGKVVDLAINRRPHDFVIGAIGLTINAEHNHAELGYWIGKPYWSKGYATEAARRMVQYGFEILGLNRIHSHHFVRNPASGRVLQKAGLFYEGTLRQHVKKWNNYEDIVCYGISRTDFNCPITRAKAHRTVIFCTKEATKQKDNAIKT